MRAGTTNRSSPLVRSFWRIQKPQTIARPHLLPRLQNLTSVLHSGPMESGPVHRRRWQGFLKLPYIGGLWSVPSASSCVRFRLSSLIKLINFCSVFHFLPVIPFWIHRPTDSNENLHGSIPVTTPDYATAERVFFVFAGGSVLSREHQLFEVLRSGDMHGMLCPNQAVRTDNHSFGFRTCGLSLLCAGAFRSCIRPAPLEDRDWWRRFGMSSPLVLQLRLRGC